MSFNFRQILEVFWDTVVFTQVKSVINARYATKHSPNPQPEASIWLHIARTIHLNAICARNRSVENQICKDTQKSIAGRTGATLVKSVRFALRILRAILSVTRNTMKR